MIPSWSKIFLNNCITCRASMSYKKGGKNCTNIAFQPFWKKKTAIIWLKRSLRNWFRFMLLHLPNIVADFEYTTKPLFTTKTIDSCIIVRKFWKDEKAREIIRRLTKGIKFCLMTQALLHLGYPELHYGGSRKSISGGSSTIPLGFQWNLTGRH